jgi:hypothetical protein
MSLKTENSRRVAKSRPVCIWAFNVYTQYPPIFKPYTVVQGIF